MQLMPDFDRPNIYGRPTLVNRVRGDRCVYRHDFPDMPSYAKAIENLNGQRYCGNRVLQLARKGWDEHVPEAMEVADKAVRMVETEVDLPEPWHDVTGAEVDMGAYMAGEPENMIDYPLMRQSNVGSVVTMIADVQCSAGVSNQAVERRGYVIAGLAMALNRLGHQTDLWVSDEYWTPRRPNERVVIRTHVKSPNDFIDPSRIMFAYAHPGVQRQMGFALSSKERGHDGRYGIDLDRGSMGEVSEMTRDMPEGTIYIPPVFRTYDNPNADVEIRRYLVQLGLLEGDD